MSKQEATVTTLKLESQQLEQLSVLQFVGWSVHELAESGDINGAMIFMERAEIYIKKIDAQKDPSRNSKKEISPTKKKSRGDSAYTGSITDGIKHILIQQHILNFTYQTASAFLEKGNSEAALFIWKQGVTHLEKIGAGIMSRQEATVTLKLEPQQQEQRSVLRFVGWSVYELAESGDINSAMAFMERGMIYIKKIEAQKDPSRNSKKEISPAEKKSRGDSAYTGSITGGIKHVLISPPSQTEKITPPISGKDKEQEQGRENSSIPTAK